MSSTQVQTECEKWILESWLPKKYGMSFRKQKLTMQGRGVFEFDAVSTDKQIIGKISTAPAVACRGSIAPGTKSQLRADCLMLALATAERKLMILTEACMHDFALREQSEGRLPLGIKFSHVRLPADLKKKLAASREETSLEVKKNSDSRHFGAV
jgi:hypothetical protein